ncbi:hypothetical protein P7C73_g4334, partial [Tremellales sp. Uapishka_1]
MFHGGRVRPVSPFKPVTRVWSSPPVVVLYRRSFSAQPSPVLEKPSTALDSSASPRQLAYDRLRPVIDSFQAPVDWAVAYGSGVIHQANASSSSPPPLTDFLLSTTDSALFHKINLTQNPHHYPSYARLLGPDPIAWLQDYLGAGVCKLNTGSSRRNASSGIWKIGRHSMSQVLALKTPPNLEPALERNHRAALYLALLLLAPNQSFTELELWEQIAGISYSGDPRMSVPGAENPEKVKNIVRGEGVLLGFREIYARFLEDIPEVRWEGKRWAEGGRGTLTQVDDQVHLGRLVSRLPENLRWSLLKRFNELDTLPKESDVWQAMTQQPKFREIISKEIQSIIRRPALTQTIKGILTAGFVKSIQYSLAKFNKWLMGRRK